jgi:hypothetical protein
VEWIQSAKPELESGYRWIQLWQLEPGQLGQLPTEQSAGFMGQLQQWKLQPLNISPVVFKLPIALGSTVILLYKEDIGQRFIKF